MYINLQPLDPYSHRRLGEIRSQYHYLLTQLSDVNAKLDLQWKQHSSSEKISRFVILFTSLVYFEDERRLENAKASPYCWS